MRKHKQKKNKQDETLFDRLCSAERRKQVMKNDVLFFGLSILLAVIAVQNSITIQ